MGCSCQKNKTPAGPSSYQVKKPGGTVVSYRSKEEALAAARRTGGTCQNC